ncbi:unnamed protein product [Brassica rapa subsp. narinosa]
MGHARKLEDDNPPSSPLNETLLIATMCIVGLQVHVHVKDGSVFSGVFYTASFENGFGIVLKNAKMTKKGKGKANVASGSVVETLVIMSPNIVQVVAEGVSLPSNVMGNNESVIVGSAMETLPSKPRLSAAKKHGIEGRGNHHWRQPGANILKRNEHIPDVHQEDIPSSSPSLDNMSERVKPIKEDMLTPEPISNGFHDAAERPSSTDKSSSRSETVDETSELCQGIKASSNEPIPIQAIKKAKEFKLNPEAKNFSPSYTKRFSPSPAAMPDLQNVAYIPSNTPMLPVPEPVYPEVGNSPYMPQTSPHSKFVPYGNLTAGNTVSVFHFPQHMSIAAIAKRRKLLDDDLVISLADTSWEILDVSSSDVSDSGLAKVSEMCKSLRAVDISRCNKITSMGVSELVQNCRSLETLRCGGCPSSESTARRSLSLFKPDLSNVEEETWEELDVTEIGHGGHSLRWLVWPRIDKDSLEMLSMECPRIVVNPKPSFLTYSLHEVPREASPDVALDEPFVKDIDPKTWVVRGVVKIPTTSSLSLTSSSSELSIAEKFRLAFAERDARLAPKRAKNARQQQRRAERDWMMSSDEAKAMAFASKATRCLRKK